MQVESDEIENLLNSDSLIRIETQISKSLGVSIYKDDLPILIQFMKKEVDSSGISIDVISKFINENEQIVVEFGLLLLKTYSIQMLSIGVSITYAIYIILLQRKDDVILREYLAKRRIPDSVKFFKQLKGIGIKMNI